MLSARRPCRHGSPRPTPPSPRGRAQCWQGARAEAARVQVSTGTGWHRHRWAQVHVGTGTGGHKYRWAQDPVWDGRGGEEWWRASCWRRRHQSGEGGKVPNQDGGLGHLHDSSQVDTSGRLRPLPLGLPAVEAPHEAAHPGPPGTRAPSPPVTPELCLPVWTHLAPGRCCPHRRHFWVQGPDCSVSSPSAHLSPTLLLPKLQNQRAVAEHSSGNRGCPRAKRKLLAVVPYGVLVARIVEWFAIFSSSQLTGKDPDARKRLGAKGKEGGKG
ncbi:uncharacterized protein LOC129543049 [Moschus berezovskii]|uniref:uncharacterized protein LOC129543049 n=1 Tax=Moschus berezovskii TaxID=68408 RepID=UPI0024439B28|nr:uncharacterized protein LOC129543049 [Moschus berezovskii]